MSTTAETSGDMSLQCPICNAPVKLGLASGHEVACPQCGHLVWFHKRCVDRAVVLDVISGTIAINTDIERVSRALLIPGGGQNVVLNLSSLKFISSAFVAGMIALQKRVRAAGGRLVLCGMHPIVRETLHGARLDTYFDIQDSEQEALQTF